MLKILFISHGKLASGMKNSVDILVGNSDKLTIFDAYLDDNNVKNIIESFYSTVNKDDQVILLSDLYGGSVNQVMYLFLDRPNTMLVAGVNLALVLELAIKDSVTKFELEEIIEQSKSMLRLVKPDIEVTEEEFF
jgi:Phosphotransferase system, mannose/fructose-specific component IIA